MRAFDPSGTSAVHCRNGFDANFKPLSKHSFEALGCRLLSLGEDMQRREFTTLLGGVAAVPWTVAAWAQHPTMPVVGYLAGASREAYSPYIALFLQGLNESSYVEGQTRCCTCSGLLLALRDWRCIGCIDVSF
jgi:hypothetical protein